MLNLVRRGLAVQALAAGMSVAAAGSALATDKFKVTNVDCETSWLWKRTLVLHYDILDERRADYEGGPGLDYFGQAAARTAAFCERTSLRPESPMNPPRKVRGVWFQSNDGQFKALYDLDRGAVDLGAGVINQIGDRFAVRQKAAAEHAAQLEEVRTREARARELKAAEEKAAQDKVVAENAREQLFFGRRDLQVSRLGVEVAPTNFALVQDVRTNPFHFRKLGVAVVRTQFNRMVTAKVALFGNDLAPILVHIEDVDRFTRSGETVMLAMKVVERGEVERSYGSVPEIVLSALKAEPIYADYVGAYTCPGDDCGRVFDAPPPT